MRITCIVIIIIISSTLDHGELDASLVQPLVDLGRPESKSRGHDAALFRQSLLIFQQSHSCGTDHSRGANVPRIRSHDPGSNPLAFVSLPVKVNFKTGVLHLLLSWAF